MTEKVHIVDSISFADGKMSMRIDGKIFTFELSRISERLASASFFEQKKYEVSPSGYGIHWPLLDEDISIDGLLGIKHLPKQVSKAA